MEEMETEAGDKVQMNATGSSSGNELVKIRTVDQEKDKEIREANRGLKMRLEQLLIRINGLEMSPPPRRRKDANARGSVQHVWGTGRHRVNG